MKNDKNERHENVGLLEEQVEKLRAKLRKRIAREELKSAWYPETQNRPPAFDVDMVTFHHLWIQPLLEAGLTLEAAINCIAQFYLQPN